MTARDTLSLKTGFHQTGAVLRRTVLGALAGLALVLPLPALADGETDPGAETFISDLASETLRLISNPGISEAERRGVFRRLLVANTDIPRFGRSALGRYSRVPSDVEFAEYLDALEDYAVAVLSSRFALFADHTVEVAGSQVRQSRSNRYVIVSTDLMDARQRNVAAIQWILIDRDDMYRIFDIVVQTPNESGSFSLLKTQRDEFTQILRTNGRDTNKLIAYLREGTVVDEAPASVN